MVIQGASLMGAIFISNPNLRIADSIDTFYKILLGVSPANVVKSTWIETPKP